MRKEQKRAENELFDHCHTLVDVRNKLLKTRYECFQRENKLLTEIDFNTKTMIRLGVWWVSRMLFLYL
jgi:hypothetical protein